MMKYRQVLQSASKAAMQRANKLPASSIRSLSTKAEARQASTAAILSDDDGTVPVGAKPFDKVLIANRGEIVQRVVRTCREMDISTVAVYSTADAKAPFVKEADEAVCLGPASAFESYLNTAAVLEAVEQTGAQALHPGYGFLSENADFARDVNEKCKFLGPSGSNIHSLGDKIESKRLAASCGVTTVPGYDDGPLQSVEHALQVANEIISYPVLLKAAAGGGGKGMRICYNDQELKEAWPLAKEEALKFFKDDRLLVEKYIEEPHHIEFQIMSSPTNNGTDADVVVFPERECSIQRRNQKILEESPSALLTDKTRRAMAEQCRLLCKAVGYESAGTVEFLVDHTGENFYFLEMNTRLQVEHPVTESVCGVDLVRSMLYVGAGWGLPDELKPFTGMDDVFPAGGHGIEARIYAEDPFRGFLPSTGPLIQYVEPKTSAVTWDPAQYYFNDERYTQVNGGKASSEYVRIDSGVTHGHVVSPHYDPMLSKVIAFSSEGRQKSLDVLNRALDEYVIEGIQHNATLVQAVVRHPAFVEGDTPTSFLNTYFSDEEGKFTFSGVDLSATEKQDWSVAAALIGLHKHGDAALKSGFERIVRLGGLFGEAYRVSVDAQGKTALVTELIRNEDQTTTEGETRTVEIGKIDYDSINFLAHVNLDGVLRTVQVIEESASGELEMQLHGSRASVLLQTEVEYELSVHMNEPIAAGANLNAIASPMPGTLIRYSVEEGDHVEEGQELCIVEAMKMQNIIRSHRAGTVSKLQVKVGSSLNSDDIILELEPLEVEEEKKE